MRTSVANLVLGSVLFLQAQSAVCAQGGARDGQPAANAAGKDAFTFYCGGVERILADPKDRGLLTALQLLDERLSELPRELNQPAPGAMIQFITELMMRPMSLRVGVPEDIDPAAGPPFHAQLNVLFDNPATAEGRAQRLGAMLQQMTRMQSRPAADMPGLKLIDVNGVPLYHGATKVEGSSALVMAVNKVSLQGVPLGAAPLPQGVQPVVAFNFDAREIQPLLDKMLNQPERAEELAPVRWQLESMGLLGERAATISGAMGYAQDRAHTALRYTNFRKLMEVGVALTDEPLTSADLRLIPADATYAQLSKYDFKKMTENLLRMAEKQNQQAREGLDQLELQFGIHPQRDLIDHLGDTIGFYTSDTTGNGGLLSAVMFMEVANPEGLSASLSRIKDLINQAGQQHAKGYVRVAERKTDDGSLTVLTFPGLPIPLELCYTIDGNWLVAAASPQGLRAALEQLRTPRSSLADNPRFKEMGGEDLDQAIQVTFLDTPRLVRSGYGIASLGAAALSNSVRSPSDPNRDPGMILPPYAELAQGAKAAVTIMRLRGDDLIATSQFDRSWLVNACGIIGIYGGPSGLAVPAMLMGVMMPALGKAQEQAKTSRAMANLCHVGAAVAIYAAEENDQVPPNLQTLIDRGNVDALILESPFAGEPDGELDVWLNTSVKRMSDSTYPDRHVLAYDRATYDGGPGVAVLFFDGHVSIMPRHEFERMIRQPPNAGTDFGLP